MAVFECTSCHRLLFRPDDLLGRAWQCPNCGPTRVSDNPVSVSAGLAKLLEAEYRLGLSTPLPGVDVRPWRPAVDESVLVNSRFVIAHHWLTHLWLVLVGLFGLAFVLVPDSNQDAVRVAFVPFVIGTVVVVIVVLPILVLREFSHRRKMEAVKAELWRAPAPKAAARPNLPDAADKPTDAIKTALSPTDVRQGE